MTLETFFWNNSKSVSNYLISPWSLLGRQQIHGKLTRMLCCQCTEITSVGTFIHLSTHFSIQLSTPYCSLSLWVTERPSPHLLQPWQLYLAPFSATGNQVINLFFRPDSHGYFTSNLLQIFYIEVQCTTCGSRIRDRNGGSSIADSVSC